MRRGRPWSASLGGEAPSTRALTFHQWMFRSPESIQSFLDRVRSTSASTSAPLLDRVEFARIEQREKPGVAYKA